MKALTGLVLILATTLSAHAGPFVSGGVPPAPRAVVIQTDMQEDGKFDQKGVDIALDLAAQYLKADQLIAIIQRAEYQEDDQKYLCIEFKTPAQFWAASKQFKQALAAHPSLEVVENGFCQ